MTIPQNQTNPSVVTGSCLCEQVQFEVLSAPHSIYQCHCSLCRKQSGSSSNAAFIVHLQQLRWLLGQHWVKTYKKPTGFTSCFCGNCGSPVPNMVGSSHYVWVPVGLLNNRPAFKVVAHLYMGSKAVWDTTCYANTNNPAQLGAVKFYETMPSLQQLLTLLESS